MDSKGKKLMIIFNSKRKLQEKLNEQYRKTTQLQEELHQANEKLFDLHRLYRNLHTEATLCEQKIEEQNKELEKMLSFFWSESKGISVELWLAELERTAKNKIFVPWSVKAFQRARKHIDINKQRKI